MDAILLIKTLMLGISIWGMLVYIGRLYFKREIHWAFVVVVSTTITAFIFLQWLV